MTDEEMLTVVVNLLMNKLELKSFDIDEKTFIATKFKAVTMQLDRETDLVTVSLEDK